jgi:hypothetical protein
MQTHDGFIIVKNIIYYGGYPMKIIELSMTTDSSGDATVSAAASEHGYIEKIVYDFGNIAANADLVITNESAISEAILTITNQAASDNVWYPRTLANKVADGTAFTDVAEKIFVTGIFKVVLADGGEVKTGRILIYLSDE